MNSNWDFRLRSISNSSSNQTHSSPETLDDNAQQMAILQQQIAQLQSQLAEKERELYHSQIQPTQSFQDDQLRALDSLLQRQHVSPAFATGSFNSPYVPPGLTNGLPTTLPNGLSNGLVGNGLTSALSPNLHAAQLQQLQATQLANQLQLATTLATTIQPTLTMAQAIAHASTLNALLPPNQHPSSWDNLNQAMEDAKALQKYATLPRNRGVAADSWKHPTDPIHRSLPRSQSPSLSPNSDITVLNGPVNDRPFLSLPRKLPQMSPIAPPERRKQIPTDAALTCDICQKKFSSTGHVARHKRSHMDERPFACPIPGCQSAFKRSDHMRQHYRTHLKRNNVSPDEIVRLVSQTYEGGQEASPTEELATPLEEMTNQEWEASLKHALSFSLDSPGTLPPDHPVEMMDTTLPSVLDLDWNVSETSLGQPSMADPPQFHTLPRLQKKPTNQSPMMFGGAARDDAVSMDIPWEPSYSHDQFGSEATLAGISRDWNLGFE